MKVAISCIYYKAVCPSFDVVDMDTDTWREFFLADGLHRKDIACKILKTEFMRSSIKEIAWVPLDDQDILVEKYGPKPKGKRKLYFDMDGTLVDFQSGVDRLTEEQKASHPGHPEDVEGVFALMDPMPGAVEAVKRLSKYYDCHILSTAPWNNPSAWSDKLLWVKKHLGKELYKKVTLTHHKELLNDGHSFLIDDRETHGAKAFGRNLFDIDPENPDWPELADLLVSIAERENDM